MDASWPPTVFSFGTLELERDPLLPLPRLIFRASGHRIDDAGISQLFASIEGYLGLNIPFTVLYDLRTCPMPSRKQISTAQAWGKVHKQKIDTLIQGIAIVISSAFARSTVNMILAMTKPAQPCSLVADEAAAFAFARDKCTEVRQWVNEKKDPKKKRHRGASAVGIEEDVHDASDGRVSSDPSTAPPVVRKPSRKKMVNWADGSTARAKDARREAVTTTAMASVRVQAMRPLPAGSDLPARRAHTLNAMQAVTMPDASRCYALLARMSGCGLLCGSGGGVHDGGRDASLRPTHGPSVPLPPAYISAGGSTAHAMYHQGSEERSHQRVPSHMPAAPTSGIISRLISRRPTTQP